MDRVALGQTLHFPIRSRNEGLQTTITLALTPEIRGNGVSVGLKMVITPVTFIDQNGTPSPYKVACREANLQFRTIGGTLSVAAAAPPDINIERTTESSSERTIKANPKIGIKVGFKEVGLDAEVGEFAFSNKKSDARKISGTDYTPEIRQKTQTDTAYWTIRPGELEKRDAVLDCEQHFTADCQWDAARQGQIRLFSTAEVISREGIAKSGMRGMLLRFIHWQKARRVSNNAQPEFFEIDEG